MPLHDAVGINCKKGIKTFVKPTRRTVVSDVKTGHDRVNGEDLFFFVSVVLFSPFILQFKPQI